MADIFVSYRRIDREKVAPIVELLEAQGWAVWWDQRITAGEQWDAVIEQELNIARCVVVVWSPSSVSSTSVRNEAGEGLRRGILAPVSIGVALPPLQFRHIQAIDFSDWRGGFDAEPARRFVAGVRRVLTARMPTPQPGRQPDTDLTWTVPFLFLAAVVLLGLLFSESGSPTKETPPTKPSSKALPEAERKQSKEPLPKVEPEKHLRLDPEAGRKRRLEAEAKQLRRGNKPLTRGEISRQRPGDIFQECELCPTMVVIGPGSFVMGLRGRFSDFGSWGSFSREKWEQPQHQVTIAKSFALGRFEISYAQWEACERARACLPLQKWKGPDHPVREITALLANEYLTWLSKETGYRYRLPTEAEWEYSARAGTTTVYYWGDDPNAGCAYANASDVSAGGGTDQRMNCTHGFSNTAPIGSFEPNPFGLYDMLGNVSELVDDCWLDSYVGAPADGRSWKESVCRDSVYRGGSWASPPQDIRSASRYPFNAQSHHASMRYHKSIGSLTTGFRVARDLGD